MTRVTKLLAVLALLTAVGTAASAQSRVVTAREANGTYRAGRNEIKILALGNNKLRVSFELTYEYKTPAGPSANEGVADGEATIENDIAVFQPPDFAACKITIKFLKGSRIKVTQDSDDCGFGNNVRADGTYTKRSAKPPKFEDGFHHATYRRSDEESDDCVSMFADKWGSLCVFRTRLER